MRPFGAAIVLAIAAAGIAPARAADSDPKVNDPKAAELKAKVQAIFNDIASFIEQKDLDSVVMYSLADSRVRYADGKEYTLPGWRERARTAWASVKSVKSKIVVDDVRMSADSVLVKYHETHDMVLVSPDDASERRVLYEAKWRATMQRRAEGFRLSRSYELERKISSDGKVLEEIKEAGAGNRESGVGSPESRKKE
jgi:hypothetical protein